MSYPPRAATGRLYQIQKQLLEREVQIARIQLDGVELSPAAGGSMRLDPKTNHLALFNASGVKDTSRPTIPGVD